MRRLSGALGLALLLGLGSLVLSACGDDPFAVTWQNAPDTAEVYSRARSELYLPTAFNFPGRRPVYVEEPTSEVRWDMLVDTDGDGLVMLPTRAVGVVSTAGIFLVGGTDFEEVREAPGDSTRYVRDEPVEVVVGNVYVIRSHSERGAFGERCIYYSKMQPLEEDVANGVLTFLFDTNPICNDRNLIAPD